MALEPTGIEFVAEGGEAFAGAIDDASDSLEAFEDTSSEASDSFDAFGDIVTGALMRVGEIAIETALSAGSALVDFAKDSLAGALDAEKGLTKLRGAIKRAGDQAPITEQQALELAESLKGLAGGSDDAVIAAQAVLLKFQSIGEDTFPQALQASLDLAAILGTDASGAAEKLGRALGNPEGASRLLREAGIFLTDTEKELLKTFSDTGNEAAAQQFILDKLATTTSGAAAQAASTASGQWAVFKETIADAGEGIASAFLPILQILMDNYLKPLLPIIESVAEAIGNQIGPAFSSLAVNFGDINELLDLIVKALDEMFKEFSKSAPEMKKIGNELFQFLKSEIGILLPQVIGNLVSIIKSLTQIWREHGDEIMQIISFTFRVITATIGGAIVLITGAIDVGLQTVAGAFKFWTAVFSGDWETAWSTLVGTVKGIFDTVISTIKTFVGLSTSIISTEMQNTFNDLVFNITSGLQGAIINGINSIKSLLSINLVMLGWDIMRGIAEGIRNASFFVFSAIFDGVWGAIDYVKNSLGIRSPSKAAGDILGEPLGEGVAEGIWSSMGDIVSALQGVTFGAMNAMVSPVSTNGISGNVTNNNSRSLTQNLTVNSAQNSQGIISDFSILQAMA